MEKEIELRRGEGILLRSPLRFEVLSGEVESWGTTIDGTSVDLEGIELLIVSRSDVSKLKVDGSFGRISNPIPEWWLNLPEKIVGKKVMLIGRVDSGKSSTMLYFINKIVSIGTNVGIVDSDIGQSDLGPPGVISSKTIEEPVLHTKILKPDFMYFIGDKTPSGHFLPMIRGSIEALEAVRSSTVLINTTGFVDGGAARALKRFKAEFLEPDIVIAIERKEGDLDHIARSLPKDIKVYKVKSPVGKSAKERSYRIAVRRSLLRKFLEGSKTLELDLSSLELRNTYLFTGESKPDYIPFLETVLGTKILWLEESPDMLIVLTEVLPDRRKIANIADLLHKEVKVGTVQHYNGLYVGLLGKGRCLGIGILESIDLNKKSVRITTPVHERNIEGLAFGYIRFNANGEEIGTRGMNIP